MEVDHAEINAAEKGLIKARVRAAEPWGERIAGTRNAAREADQAVRRHAAEHFDALVIEVDDRASAAAERVDRALAEIGAAYAERQKVDAHLGALVAAAIGQSSPGLITYSKVDRIVRAAEAVLMAGGERRPALTRDPRTPRAGPIAEVGA
jgi:hypothetical protein